ncbi:MAG: nitroreductase family protein [Candidatus Marinimicrobia bacterium CG08_land_8_20_14_0_20_45_22]|nr:MAG: nitroreductase family protein [Candidatus Marinimicrobia bacterium CG08_land_8_20_14_0_20_45_22]
MNLDYIFRRRSIREFTNEPVSDEHLELILKSGMAAPSAHDLKPWHFIIIRDRTKLNKIADLHPYAKMLYQAPVCIAVCGDVEISSKRWDQDCAAATENILLSLPELNLGGVWIGYHPEASGLTALFDELFGLPQNIRLFSLIAVGRPAEEKPSRTQFDANRVHFEKF